MRKCYTILVIVICCTLSTWAADDLGQRLLDASGMTGGLCLQIGGDADLAAGIAGSKQMLTHMLHTDADFVAEAQQQLRDQGLYGLAWAECRPDLSTLPYTENFVNLIVVTPLPDGQQPPAEEIARIVAPLGVILIHPDIAIELRDQWAGTSLEDDLQFVDVDGAWGLMRKPWPDGMDEWTHPRHAADNSPVSKDTFVGPPRRVRWVTGPLWGVGDLVSAKGRNFYGNVLARDSFNGLPLWKRPMGYNGYSTSYGPDGMHPVAVGDRVYAVLGDELQALDATTGETIQTYPDAGTPRELYAVDDVLVLASIYALRVVTVDDGEVLWERKVYDPTCVVAADDAVFFTEGNVRRGEPRQAYRVDLKTGDVEWSLKPAQFKSQSHELDWIPDAAWCSYADGLLLYEASSFSDFGDGNAVHVVDAKTGDFLWSHPFAPHGHAKQARAFRVGDMVYILQDTQCQGLDVKTGEVKVETDTFGGHCYPPVATQDYFISGEMSWVNLSSMETDSNRITKGSCGRYNGFTPANGLININPKSCVCWPFLNGHCALAPEKTIKTVITQPAFAIETLGTAPATTEATATDYSADEWPVYRHDGWRSGSTASTVPTDLTIQWAADLGAWPDSAFLEDWQNNRFVQGPVSSPTVANGMVYVARPDAHEVLALDADTGAVAWRFTANSRVDGPPTLYQGLCLFGTRNGWVYCLNAASGETVWRFRAAPDEERIVSFGQVESPWPVPASVLVVDGTAYFGAGRQYLADGGIRIFALDAATGSVKWNQTITDFPGKNYYAANSLEFDGFDLMHREGAAVTMSRWHFDVDSGALELDQDSGFAHLTTGGTGVMAPRGLWTYGPRMGRGNKADRRPLGVFHDNTYYGAGVDEPLVYRRDFTPDELASFDTSWFNYRLVSKAEDTGEGDTSRTDRLIQKAAWQTPLDENAAITAMVLANDIVFAATDNGKLTALAADGTKLAEHEFPQTAWDGMAAAYGRLYIATRDGRLICLASGKQVG